MKHILEFYKWDLDKVRGPKVSPPKYLYHISESKYRSKILSEGLQPSVGKSYSDWAKTKDAIPAVFATVVEGDDVFKELHLSREMMDRENMGNDLWQIDTFKCNNEWFKDNHFEDIFDNNPHVVTFEAVPRSALRLFYRNKYL